MKDLLLNKKIIIAYTVFVIICLLYPIYYISDDWEHINAFYEGRTAEYIGQYFYRLPSLYYTHQLIFPLFRKGYFGLATWICWSFLFIGMLINIRTFNLEKLLLKHSSLFVTVFLIAICLNPNNYEWLFWPTVMVNFPGFFAICLGVYLTVRYEKSLWVKIIKSLLFTYAMYCYENLIFFGLLLEFSYVILKKDNFKEGVKFIFKSLSLPFLFLISTKLYLNSLQTYPYVAKTGFKLHLFKQYLLMNFGHDYYKARWLSGSFALLTYILMLMYLIKSIGLKRYLKTEGLILILIILGGFYYYTIMDYSGRRAIGGQVFFSWFYLCAVYLRISCDKNGGKLKKVILILFPLCWIGHSFYVLNAKYTDKKAYQRNVKSIKERIKIGEKNILINRDVITKGVKTSWNDVLKEQELGFIKHFFTKEEQKIIFLDTTKN